MKTLAGSVAVGHIAQLEDELSQARAERDNASALCAAARAVANAAEDKADNLEAMVESLESQLVRAKATTKHWRKVLAVSRDMRRAAEHERGDARRHACRLMWERDEARGERDKLRLANHIYRDDVRNLHARIVVLKTEGYCGYDPHEVASLGYEVDRGGEDA